mmetsp:Transcript_10746/g.22873  ORF Transcript_10746/g.22873 Transcript_10746/m.22873 type:complete len:192 (-) Transcript_10746:441-1016(-)
MEPKNTRAGISQADNPIILMLLPSQQTKKKEGPDRLQMPCQWARPSTATNQKRNSSAVSCMCDHWRFLIPLALARQLGYRFAALIIAALSQFVTNTISNFAAVGPASLVGEAYCCCLPVFLLWLLVLPIWVLIELLFLTLRATWRAIPLSCVKHFSELGSSLKKQIQGYDELTSAMAYGDAKKGRLAKHLL